MLEDKYGLLTDFKVSTTDLDVPKEISNESLAKNEALNLQKRTFGLLTAPNRPTPVVKMALP
jgi:hypothetical protein